MQIPGPGISSVTAPTQPDLTSPGDSLIMGHGMEKPCHASERSHHDDIMIFGRLTPLTGRPSPSGSGRVLIRIEGPGRKSAPLRDPEGHILRDFTENLLESWNCSMKNLNVWAALSPGVPAGAFLTAFTDFLTGRDSTPSPLREVIEAKIPDRYGQDAGARMPVEPCGSIIISGDYGYPLPAYHQAREVRMTLTRNRNRAFSVTASSLSGDEQ